MSKQVPKPEGATPLVPPLKLVARSKPNESRSLDNVYWFLELLTRKSVRSAWEIHRRFLCYYEHEPDKYLHWDGRPQPGRDFETSCWGRNYKTEKDAIMDALHGNSQFDDCQTFSPKAAAAVEDVKRQREIRALADQLTKARSNLIDIKEEANTHFRDRCGKLKPQNHEKEKKRVLEMFEPRLAAQRGEIAALEAKIAELTKGRYAVRSRRKR